MGRNGLGFLLAALLLPLPAAPAGTTPRLEQVVLRFDDREAKPSEVAPAIPGQIAAGPVRLTISDDSIIGFQDASGRPAWTAAIPTGTSLRFLGHDGGKTAFFALTTRALGREYSEPGDRGEVGRLSLADGRWIPSLRPPVDKGLGTAGVERVRAVLIHGGRVAVLASTDRAWRGEPHESGPVWRITCFKGQEPAWSRTFPLRWFPGRERLAALPSGLLVCAGPREDLLLLDPNTGATIAAIERVWEFRRLGSLPFRSRPVLVRAAETDPGRGGPEWAPAHRPRLLDAPAVLFRPDGRARVFAPVGRRMDGAWQAGLCEMDDRLELVDVLALPPETRDLDADPIAAVDAVVWTGRARSGPGRHKGDRGAPCFLGLVAVPGKPLRIWLRPDQEPEGPDAWLTPRPHPWLTVERDPAVPRTADDRSLYRVTEGAWIAEPDDDRIHFPVSRVDLATGAESTLDLVVPFEGGPEYPRDCAFSLRSPTFGPRTDYRDGTGCALSVYGLEVTEEVLRISVRWRRDVHLTLAFPLADLRAD